MVDWSGEATASTPQRYRFMAQRQLRGVSPTYERLCLGVADDRELIERLDALPRAKRQPNLLLAAVRFHDGPVDGYPQFRRFVLQRWEELAGTMLARRTQTNEPRRCTALLPVLAALPGPLALLEVGASAGLCLYPDRYAYRYGDRPVLGDSPVVLDCAVAGAVPFPEHRPQIAGRAGLDLNPLDLADQDDVRWLEALVWPEHADRLAVLQAAIALAKDEPSPVRRGDLTCDLAEGAAQLPADATLVVYHSAALAYVDPDGRAAFRAEVAALARDRPVVWMSNEGPGVVVDVPVPDGPVPFVLAVDGRAVAYTDPHGRSIDWLD